MLKRLIDRQQQQFLEQGGIKEQMFRARSAYRNQNQTGRTSQTSPTGPTSQTGLTGPTNPSNPKDPKKH